MGVRDHAAPYGVGVTGCCGCSCSIVSYVDSSRCSMLYTEEGLALAACASPCGFCRNPTINVKRVKSFHAFYKCLAPSTRGSWNAKHISKSRFFGAILEIKNI